MTGNQLVQYLRNGYGILVSKHNYKQILKLIESEDPNLKTSADEPITKLNPFCPYSLDLSVIYIEQDEYNGGEYLTYIRANNRCIYESIPKNKIIVATNLIECRVPRAKIDYFIDGDKVYITKLDFHDISKLPIGIREKYQAEYPYCEVSYISILIMENKDRTHILKIGKPISKEDFDNYVRLLKKCGDRLGQIVKEYNKKMIGKCKIKTIKI